jgi:hypothetical protein
MYLLSFIALSIAIAAVWMMVRFFPNNKEVANET